MQTQAEGARGAVIDAVFPFCFIIYLGHCMRSPGCASISSRGTALPSVISRLFLPSPIYHRSDCIVLICPWICFPDWTRTFRGKVWFTATFIPSRNPAQTAQVQEYLVGRLHPTFAELRYSQKHLPPFWFSIHTLPSVSPCLYTFSD